MFDTEPITLIREPHETQSTNGTEWYNVIKNKKWLHTIQLELSKNNCPGHFKSDCKLISEYVFYLVFENSECHEYLTEKGFYHAYSKGAIPIIMGPTVTDCETLLPPNSYLHVDNYKSVEDLAKHIKYISERDSNILEYHNWRRSFEVVNEHGYFGSPSLHYCRVCEALNYNDKSEKIYDEKMLGEFLDPSKSCK